MKVKFSMKGWLHTKVILMLFALMCFNQLTKAQDAFIGYDYETDSYPLAWSSPNTFNVGTDREVQISYSGGSVKTNNICNSTDKISHYELGGTAHLIEVTLPHHNVSSFVIELTGSTNSSSLYKGGVIYSDKSPFDPNSCISAEETGVFPANNGNWTKINITPPAGAKSFRLYRRVYLGVDGKLYTGSGSNPVRTVYGDNGTLRIASVGVWATARPTTQSINFAFTNVATHSMDVNFTRGNGSKVVVFAKEGTGAITNPVDDAIYTASDDWVTGSPIGTQLGTSGYYCVYNGTGNTLSLSNLKPNTTYTFQAFEYSGTAIISNYLTTTALGNPRAQATLPLTVPTLATVAINAVFSTKANSGGVITGDGGSVVTETGLVWSTTANPTTASSGKLKIGINDLPFNGQIKGLLPSTTYFVRAYAVNAIGTGYGNEVSFTTAAPAPVLASSFASISFGNQFYNVAPAVLTYNLENNGADFSTATGNITITAPVGFLVSTNATSGFASSITVPYTNSKLGSTPIYVKLPTGLYGKFSGEITHSGANVLAGDADRVTLQGSVVQEEISNKGTDFWLGFGYMSDMNYDASNSDAAKMIIYVATGEQSADVTVMMPNGQYSQTKTVPPHSIEKFENFPRGDKANTTNAPDSRLFRTGVQDKAIHLTSNGVPVSVWTYSYTGDNSAAGAMIFPTNTWSSSYTVQAYGNISNSSSHNPNSFFFVIPEEDNTSITFTPTVDILKSTIAFTSGNSSPGDVEYLAGQTYTVNLNKGQVFNAMGFIQGTGSRNALGLDLSGTSITTNDCNKKIAVFAGNGRSLSTASYAVSGSLTGSDNIVQQMLPNIAWGTRYLTVPTKTMEYNVFRIYVQENLPANTIVKVNGTVLDANYIKNGIYYEYEANTPLYIEGNKPISVTQLILSQSYGGAPDKGNSGKGDPEMIVLSPVQQAIKSSIVATPELKGPAGLGAPRSSYINVIIKKEGVASFKLDGVSLALDTGTNSFDVNNNLPFGPSSPVDAVDAFKVHPNNSDYFFAKLRVSMGEGIIHTISSDYPFNAIAYGLGTGESYAFNAGATVQNLSSIKLAVNTSATDTSSTTVKVAKGTPTRLKIALPYPPATVSGLQWVVSDATISPAGSQNGATASGAAVYETTTVVDGRTYYIYSSPVQYTFSESGSHPISVLVSGSFGGDCGGSDVQRVPVLVGLDDINIAYTTNCGNPEIAFTNTTAPMEGTTITKWAWDFGDGTSSDLQNPTVHTYNKVNGAVYTVRLTTTNTAGIVSTKTLAVDFSGSVTAAFTNNATSNAVCLGNAISFDPASSAITNASSGTANKWTWNFGDGTAEVVVNGATKTVQSHTYINTGQYTVTLKMETTTGCSSIATQTINVFNLVPTVVTSTATINSIEFTWSAVADATAYQVSTDGGLNFTTPSSGTTGLSHAITGMNPDQTVNILVQAKALGACESVSLPYSDKTLFPDLELFVPNTFTPNGDGKNDVLLPYSNYMQSVNLRVFNQWGQQVFNTTELNKGWDGTYKGTEQPVGVYIYVVSVVMQNGEKVNKKGSVNLIR